MAHSQRTWMSRPRRTRTQRVSEDAFDSCKSFSKSVQSVWRILTPEEVISKTFLKDQILEAIRTKVKSLLYKPEQYSDDDDQSEEHLALGVLFNENENFSRTAPPPSKLIVADPELRKGVISLLFPLETFRLITNRGWLPDVVQSMRIIYELDRNHLIVHMASPAHDAAANSWNERIALWSTNGGASPSSLRQLGRGRMTCLRSQLTIPEYRWTADSEKSPDQSFVARNIQFPPALVIPGTLSAPYPSMVIQISKSHETYNELLEDAAVKHFSTSTSVRVWVGAKLYPGHGGRFKAMFRLRDPATGGVLAGSGASTGFLSLNQTTNIEFIIPKTEIYFGVVPLPPTLFATPGQAALPPPQNPGQPTDDLVLPVEELREAVYACL